MATPRPKEFVAATDFTHMGKSFVKGDPITQPSILQSLLRFGDTFAVAKTATRHADSPTGPTEGEVTEPESEEDI